MKPRGRAPALGALGLLAAVAACSVLPGPSLTRPAPLRVLERPLALVPGMRVSSALVTRHLQRAGYRLSADAKVGPGELRVLGRRIEVGRRPFRYPDGADPGGFAAIELDAAGRLRTLRDRDGTPLRELWLEPGPLGERAAESEWFALERFPQVLIDAVLVAEDRRFWSHPGVDFLRIAGAALRNGRAGRVVEGASTLTQQLARSVHLTRERSLSRKLRETGIALWLELRHSKREILEAYLNEVYLGQEEGRPIRGFGRAARALFDADVSQLGVAESALLAATIRAPNRFSPERHPERARAERARVLGLLLAEGRIEAEAHARALRAPLGIRRSAAAAAFAPHFAGAVRARVAGELGSRSQARGYRVFTTLDGDVQRAAERAVRGELADLEARFPGLRRSRAPVEAALVALDPQRGEVLAWVGGRDFARSSFDRVAEAHRQPGSVFKPIVALAALTSEDEPPFTLATLLADVPLRLAVEGETWAPANHDGRYRGAVTLRAALEESLNVPFARLGLETGLVRVAETARRLGIGSPLRPVPSLSLGAFELTPLEVAAAYAVLAAGGVRSAPRSVLAVVTRDGRSAGGERGDAVRVFPEAETYLVTSALQGAVRRGTGRALASHGVSGVAGKTGTSDGARDAWFVAYTPDLVAAVWVGFDGEGRIGLTGAQAALPIFARFYRELGGARAAWPEPPAGVERALVHGASGLRAGPGCSGAPELFARGTAPARRCRAHPFAAALDRLRELLAVAPLRHRP
jgi:penicillin-binding protein 1B